MSADMKVRDFIKNSDYIRDCGQSDTNIITRGIGCACIPSDVMQQFLATVEQARREGTNVLVAEKQTATGSGIFIDVDVQQEAKITEHQFDLRFYNTLIRQLFNVILEIFDLHDYPKQTVTVGITQKKQVIEKKLADGTIVNSAGFHILIPGLKITRAAKKYLISELIRLNTVGRLIESRGIQASASVDIMSATTVNFFVGCPRDQGKLPHELAYVFDAEIIDGADVDVMISRIELTNPKINIVGEFSLNYETPERLIPKIQINPNPKHAALIEESIKA